MCVTPLFAVRTAQRLLCSIRHQDISSGSFKSSTLSDGASMDLVLFSIFHQHSDVQMLHVPMATFYSFVVVQVPLWTQQLFLNSGVCRAHFSVAYVTAPRYRRSHFMRPKTP